MASQLQGVKALTGKITELGAKLAAKELRGVTKTAMQEAEHVARARIPQGTEPHYTYKGRLVSAGYALSTLHIETYVDKKTGSAVALLGVGREAFYAALFVELGTSKMQARPWLQPSFEQSKDPMLRALADDLRARVERIARKRARK